MFFVCFFSSFFFWGGVIVVAVVSPRLVLFVPCSFSSAYSFASLGGFWGRSWVFLFLIYSIHYTAVSLYSVCVLLYNWNVGSFLFFATTDYFYRRTDGHLLYVNSRMFFSFSLFFFSFFFIGKAPRVISPSFLRFYSFFSHFMSLFFYIYWLLCDSPGILLF